MPNLIMIPLFHILDVRTGLMNNYNQKWGISHTSIIWGSSFILIKKVIAMEDLGSLRIFTTIVILVFHIIKKKMEWIIL